MRSSLPAAAAFLALSACQTGPGPDGSAAVSSQALNDSAMTIVNGTRTACDFAPNVGNIIAILQGGESPRTQAVIDGICNEVRQIPNVESDLGPREVAVNYGGTRVEGVLSPAA